MKCRLSINVSMNCWGRISNQDWCLFDFDDPGEAGAMSISIG